MNFFLCYLGLDVEEFQNDEEDLSLFVMEYNIDVKLNIEIQLVEINKDVVSIFSEFLIEFVKDFQEV